MKKYNRGLFNVSIYLEIFFLLLLLFGNGSLWAQDTIEAKATMARKPVKSTFGSIWLIDNQTVMVPIKGTFEADFQHRFGTVKNGYSDFWGLFAPSNIRLGFSYTPVNKLNIGLGITKERTQWDINAKYALLQQTKDNAVPVSIAYFGNVVVDGRTNTDFRYFVHRLSYFSQLMVARKLTEKFSAQVSPSLSWFNNVEAYVDTKGEIQNKMNNLHFAIAFLGRFKLSETLALIANYDQPLTQHPTNNPHPNISFGIEVTTSSHAFQVFMGNYKGIVPQSNNMYNQNDYTKGQFLIGFNISRLWNF